MLTISPRSRSYSIRNSILLLSMQVRELARDFRQRRVELLMLPGAIKLDLLDEMSDVRKGVENGTRVFRTFAVLQGAGSIISASFSAYSAQACCGSVLTCTSTALPSVQTITWTAR
jgi:hypothetical protein